MRTSFLSSTGALANCFASGQRELRCEGVGADSIQRSAAARLVRIARCAVAEAEVHAVEWLIGKECPPPRLYGSSQVGGGRKQRAYKAAERVCAELSATALATVNARRATVFLVEARGNSAPAYFPDVPLHATLCQRCYEARNAAACRSSASACRLSTLSHFLRAASRTLVREKSFEAQKAIFSPVSLDVVLTSTQWRVFRSLSVSRKACLALEGFTVIRTSLEDWQRRQARM